MNKYFLVLILSFIFLSGCSQPASLKYLPLSATPIKTMSQTTISMPSKTPSPGATETLAGTTDAELRSTSIATQPDEPGPTPLATTTIGTCKLDPISQPPWPIDSLLPNEVDPETGLHVTGKPQLIDLVTYRLNVTGMVEHPLSLTYDDLRCMRSVTASPELICPTVFVDEATWTGVPVKDVLDLAGVQPGAKTLTLVSADGYEVKLSLELAADENNILAYKVNGMTLPVQHGFPLRAVIPSMTGYAWIKWLVEIRIS